MKAVMLGSVMLVSVIASCGGSDAEPAVVLVPDPPPRVVVTTVPVLEPSVSEP